MPERIRPTEAEPVSRVLVERRCDVYAKAAALIMDLEEALLDDDGQRARFVLQDLRRCLRGALAFLSSDVFHELERLESLGDGLPSRAGGSVPGDVADELADAVQLLHVKLARVLTQPDLEPLEQIVGLPSRLKHKLVAEDRAFDVRSRRQALEAQCFELESEARELIGRKEYGKAVKSLKRAIRLDAERPVLHNDLGVVLSLVGRNREAIEAYRTAVSLNEQCPERRTDEWTTSYYNLGIALRKVALEQIRAARHEVALDGLRQAQAAFEEFTRLNVSGSKVEEAARVVQQVSAQIRELEAALEA